MHPFTPCTTVINKHVSKVFLSSFRARPCLIRASLVAQTIKNLSAKKETWVRFLGWEDPLGKEMATHSSILAWRIPWTEESGGVHSMGLQRIRHNKMANTCLIGASQVAEWLRICLPMQEHGKLTFNPWVGKIPWRSKWQPTHSSLENPMDRGAWVLKSWTHIPLFDGIPCTNLHIVCVE